VKNYFKAEFRNSLESRHFGLLNFVCLFIIVDYSTID
jgi:hypothetical protein